MKNTILLYILVATVAMVSCSEDKTVVPDQDTKEPDTYDQIVLDDNPVGYWLINDDELHDATSYELDGSWKGEKEKPRKKLPNGEKAPFFNGKNAFYEIPDVDRLEISNKGELTVEAWMSPAVLNFPNVEEGKDYIHWMGKGTPGQHSWAARMYDKDSWREDRPQRVSGYAFNLDGGLGAGSYFQTPISTGEWIHYVFVVNTNNTSDDYPTGYTKLYRNGKLEDKDDLSDYDIIPENGTAPTRVGTRDTNSYFKGSIAKVAIYGHELSAQKIEEHYKSMTK